MTSLHDLNAAMNGRAPKLTKTVTTNVGWHPAPNGSPTLWYWDGAGWIDPIAAVEAQITELIEPHLERMYVAGFEAGFAKGSRMNPCP